MPTLPVTPGEFAIALALALVGSMIQGVIGIGLAVISAPILWLIGPVFVPGPLLIAAMILTILIAYRDRGSVIKGEVAIGTIGRVLGALPAGYALILLDERYYSLLFALLILAGVALSLSGWHLRPTTGNLLAAATLSGFTSTISAVGGPPMALVYQNEEGPRIRGTMSAIFTVGTVISMISLLSAGKFGWTELLLGLALSPAAILGFFISGYAAKLIDGPRMRPAVLIVSALSAAAIIAKVLWKDF